MPVGVMSRFLFWPQVALVFNALVWGVSWWPFREMHAGGLHPLWSSVVIYLLGGVVILAFRPSTWTEFQAQRGLWVLALAAGFTMVGFNWGVAIGEVVRVVLLFYLMPVWALLFAHFILQERIRRAGLIRAGVALLGALLVLSPEGQIGFPIPRHLGEWLGLFGGLCFALNNVMLRQQKERSDQARLFAMFFGGVWVPLGVALGLTAVLAQSSSNLIAWPIWPSSYVVLIVLVFAGMLVSANYALQFGASSLPANVTAVLMLSEVIFATVSAIWLTDESLTRQTTLGGVLIFMAALLSALNPKQSK